VDNGEAASRLLGIMRAFLVEEANDPGAAGKITDHAFITGVSAARAGNSAKVAK